MILWNRKNGEFFEIGKKIMKWRENYVEKRFDN